MLKLDSGGNAIATQDDVTAVLGHIDTVTLLAILSLEPTIADLETANLWMAGDADVFGSGRPIKGPASEIVTILTAHEEDDRGLGPDR